MTDDDARRLLKERRAALVAEDALYADARKPVTLDQESVGRLSRVDALQLQAMAKALEQRRISERARIDSALRRLDEGDYGYCLSCGEEIADARLQRDPAATQCIVCAA